LLNFKSEPTETKVNTQIIKTHEMHKGFYLINRHGRAKIINDTHIKASNINTDKIHRVQGANIDTFDI
jgi:hypothetical protein